MLPERQKLRDSWLMSIGIDPATALPLAQDASFRQYIRVELNGRAAMLMDAPPSIEKPRQFVIVTQLLEKLGARVPTVIQQDLDAGFILLEDLGDQTFTRLLADSVNDQELEYRLYHQALDALINVQRQSQTNIDVSKLPPYDFKTCLAEASLFTQWFLPLLSGNETSSQVEQEYSEIWQRLFSRLPQLPDVLVHRDYHVDNLLVVDSDCAMLDYQDALYGSPAYDTVSLLEDARRDVSPTLRDSLLARWLAHWLDQQNVDREELLMHYRFWGVQRHCKVAGIFVRLWKRDGKPVYLQHIPRVLGLLRQHLLHTDFEKLGNFLSTQIGGLEQIPEFNI